MRNAAVVLVVWALSLHSFATAHDVDILLEWKQSIQDPNKRLLLWDPFQANPCIFSGVVCLPDTTDVQMILLPHFGLIGSISPRFGELKHLQSLDLAWNSLHGSIPPQLGNLPALYALHLQKNHLTGLVPKELGQLTSLKTFYVYSNDLNGTIPVGGAMANFQNIDIWRDNPKLCGDAINVPCLG
ncbi:hypothetical protein GOP47_0027415 [Adiantum capillus-veneris]|nr:hypothetical protein GOP47_0027415 [Adiantum capillus-veneris]